jgi:hypothetical protein
MSFFKLISARTLRMGLLLVIGFMSVNAFAGRVPTKYNDRYQTLYVEQELFRKRPELLGCVALAKNFAQTNADTVFNKLRFTPKSVQSAYVVEGIQQGGAYQKVVIYGEGRVRAYSFFENWEPAVVSCDIPMQGIPKIVLEISSDQASRVERPGSANLDVTKN